MLEADRGAPFPEVGAADHGPVVTSVAIASVSEGADLLVIGQRGHKMVAVQVLPRRQVF